MDTSDEHDPLLDRVDLLLKRHKQPLRSPDDDVPVLTEVVQPESARGDVDPAAREALIAQLNDAIIRGVEAGLAAQLIDHLAPRIAALVAEEMSATRDALISDLRASLPSAIASALENVPENSGRLTSR